MEIFFFFQLIIKNGHKIKKYVVLNFIIDSKLKVVRSKPATKKYTPNNYPEL